jgi:hypothetical protein
MTFAAAFQLAGVDHPLPPGDYEVIIDEELIEGLSFPVYRRTATWIMARLSEGTTEMVAIDPVALDKAIEHDRKLRSGSSQ